MDKTYAIVVLAVIFSLTAYNVFSEICTTDLQRGTAACRSACSYHVESYTHLPDGTSTCVCDQSR